MPIYILTYILNVEYVKDIFHVLKHIRLNKKVAKYLVYGKQSSFMN